jgi:aryl-alcohol dehydrogenase
MTTTTQAAVLRDRSQPFLIEEVTLDNLRPDEILVSIAGVGMCHTDLVPRSGVMAVGLPIVLGHEGSGVVSAVGRAVTSVVPGDHVLISFASCGTCAHCLLGEPAYCEEFAARNTSGLNHDGTAAHDGRGVPVATRWFGQSSFAQHAVTNERNLVAVDRGLPLHLLGPLGCGLQTGAGAVLNEMRLAPGQSLAVFGAGAVGLAAVMAAKLAGAADIVVVDLNGARLGLATELGATRTVVGGKDDVVEQVIGSGPGMDFSFETTAVTEVISSAVSVLTGRGTAIFVGAGSGVLTIPAVKLAGRKITYVIEGNSVPQVLLPRLIQFWQQGLFPFDKLVRTYSPADINLAEADSLSGATIKPVLIP